MQSNQDQEVKACTSIITRNQTHESYIIRSCVFTRAWVYNEVEV